MDGLRWIEWLLDVSQDEIQPAIAGANHGGPRPEHFASVRKWAEADARRVPPVLAWARALPTAALDRYRRDLTRFFSERVISDRVPRNPRSEPPKPLSDEETAQALAGVSSIFEWLRRPRNVLGLGDHWNIRPKVLIDSETGEQRINPDVGQLYYGTATALREGKRVTVPFVRVEYYDRGLHVIEEFAHLAKKYWPRIRECDNSACTRGGARCRRMFLAVKRQINCSLECKNHKGQRAHRERLRSDEQKRRVRRQAQKKSAATGPHKSPPR